MNRRHHRARRAAAAPAPKTIEVEIDVLHTWVERGEVHVLIHAPGLGMLRFHWPIDDLIGAPQ